MSLLSNILNYKQQQDYLATQKEHARTSALTQTLLDRAADPNTTADEQAILYNEIGSLMGGGKGKGKANAAFGGPVGSLIGLFLHHDHAGTDVNDNPLAGLVGQMEQKNKQPTNPTVTLAPDVTTTIPTRSFDDTTGEIQMPVPGGITETPGKRYGEMTLGELADARKLGLYSQQQDILDKRDIANDERTRQLRLDEVTAKAKAAAERQSQRFENNLSLVDAREAAQARKDMDSAVLRIKAADPTVTDDQARALAGQQLNGQIESLIEQRKASASLSNARALSEPIKVQIMQRNATTNERRAQTYEIRTQADVDKINDDLGGGMSAGQKRLYDTQAAPWLIQLRTSIAEKQRLEEDVAAYRSTQVQAGPSIAAAETRASEAAQRLQEIRDALSTSTVPSRSHGAQRSSAGTEDPQVRDYANKYFGGDYQAAVRAIQAQRRR